MNGPAMARWGAIVTLWLAMGAVACAPTLPRPYLEAKTAGHRAYGSGRYDEAAAYFHEAATKADTVRNRDEVLYLEAASYQRSGRIREARQAYQALLQTSPKGARAARAAYELAQFELEKGDPSEGWEMIRTFPLRFPKSGLARRALLRYLGHLDEVSGKQAAIDYAQRNHAWFHAHGLGETAMYQSARRLEDLGRLEEARDGYVRTADIYPYPDGGLFDDSLYRASLLDEKLGNPEQAVAHLRHLLSVREPATFSGSYERPRFSEAQMRIAELYRDALGKPAEARREFHKLFTDFETSSLRDDALWAEARIAAKQGDAHGACEAATLLVRALPTSRYAPCAQLLCSTAPKPPEDTSCRRYIQRELSGSDQ